MKTLISLLVLSCLIVPKLNFGQGSQYALTFDGDDDYLQMGAPLPIGTGSSTYEAWLKAPSLGNGGLTSGERVGVLLGSYDSAPHFNYEVYSDGKLRIYWNAGEVDAFSSIDLRDDLWHHLAIVRDESSLEFRIYIDGILDVTISNIGSDLTLTTPHRMGGDNRNTNGGHSLHGTLDEVRIWDDVRTEAEIRDNMCHTLTGSEANLIRYYTFNESTGSDVVDETSNDDLVITNADLTNIHSISGAPIGDVSFQEYTSTWSAFTSILSSSNGDLTIDNVSGFEGLHFYRIDALPLIQNGIPQFYTNTTHFGVFKVGSGSYDLNYDYSNFTDALTYESDLLLYNRLAADETPWANSGANIDVAADLIDGTFTTSNEFTLGFLTGSCNDPSNLNASNISTNSAVISWDGDNSTTSWTLEYGVSGFNIGNGTIDTSYLTSMEINNLQANEDYDIYITSNCNGIGNSNQIGPLTFTTQTIPSNTLLGSKMSIHLDGQDDFIELEDTLTIGSGNSTVETWVKIPKVGTGNLDASERVGIILGNYGTSNNVNYEFNNKGMPRVYWNDGEKDISITSGRDLRDNLWHHVASVRDTTNNEFRFYVDGSLIYTSTGVGSEVNFVAPHRIGGDRRNQDGGPSFHGELDELRIWNKVRTQEEIKDYMCEKLHETEQGLQHYFKFDETTGVSTMDQMNNSVNTLTNMATIGSRLVSGAPVGDDSEHLYNQADWSLVNISINTNGQTVPSVLVNSGTPEGIHIYKVNGITDVASTTPLLASNNGYYGVFIAEENKGQTLVQFELDYNGYTDAESNENDLALLNRFNKSSPMWTINNYDLDINSNTITSSDIALMSEFVISTVASQICDYPTGLSISHQTTDSAEISWSSMQTGASHVIWGQAGFEINNTSPQIANTNSFGCSPLELNEVYHFYVQDTCSNGESLWVGPFTFSGERCLEPENIVIDSITSGSANINWSNTNGEDWTIAWSATTIVDPEWAVHTVSNANPTKLENLQELTTYEFYIRTNCSNGSSYWVGPFDFTTSEMSDVGITELSEKLKIQPNPNNGTFNISSNLNIKSIELISTTGQKIALKPSKTNEIYRFESLNVNAGLYYILVQTQEGDVIQKRIIIQ